VTVGPRAKKSLFGARFTRHLIRNGNYREMGMGGEKSSHGFLVLGTCRRAGAVHKTPPNSNISRSSTQNSTLECMEFTEFFRLPMPPDIGTAADYPKPRTRSINQYPIRFDTTGELFACSHSGFDYRDAESATHFID
jgi:hypothetical protein